MQKKFKRENDEAESRPHFDKKMEFACYTPPSDNYILQEGKIMCKTAARVILFFSSLGCHLKNQKYKHEKCHFVKKLIQTP